MGVSMTAQTKHGQCAQPTQTADLRRLDRFWGHDTIFNLVFASSDDLTRRQALIERLSESEPARCMAIEVSMDLSPMDLLTKLEMAWLAGIKRVQVIFPERHPSLGSWWQRANTLRERLADSFPGTILVWMNDADIDVTAHNSPDLWNWRAAAIALSSSSRSPSI